LSTTSQIIGGGSANPFFYIVFTAGIKIFENNGRPAIVLPI
jgi:hypothetical protein